MNLCVLSVIVGIIGVALAFVYFVINRHLIFKKYIMCSRIPHLKTKSYIYGDFYSIVTSKESIAQKIEEHFETLGETYLGFAGAVPWIFTKDLDLLYHVWVKYSHKHINRPYLSTPTEHSDVSLLQARDEIWRRTRRAIGSTMTPAKLNLANVERDIDLCLDKLMSSLAGRSANERTIQPGSNGSFVVDCQLIFKTFIMDTFLNVAFDQPNEIDYNLANNKIVTDAKKTIEKANSPIVTWTFFIRGLTPIIRFMVRIFKLNGFLHSLCDMLNVIICKIGNSDRQLDQSKRKMIHLLMDLYFEKKLNREELVSNALFLLMAGFDTTSESLTALMWQLAVNSDIQEKLRSDIMKHGINSNYLSWSIKESLRLHSPAATAREIGEDFEWKGYTIMKGMALIMPPYSLMMDQKTWGSDVNQFKPERFDPNSGTPEHSAHYVAFGLGPRNCVGYHLAMLEMKMTTCRLLMNYKIKTSIGTPKSLLLKEGTGTIFFVNILKDKIPLEFVPLGKQ